MTSAAVFPFYSDEWLAAFNAEAGSDVHGDDEGDSLWLRVSVELPDRAGPRLTSYVQVLPDCRVRLSRTGPSDAVAVEQRLSAMVTWAGRPMRELYETGRFLQAFHVRGEDVHRLEAFAWANLATLAESPHRYPDWPAFTEEELVGAAADREAGVG